MDLSKFNSDELKNIKKEIDIELRKRNPEFKNTLISKILYNSNISNVIESLSYFELNDNMSKDTLLKKIEESSFYNELEEKILNVLENINELEKFSAKDFDIKYKYQNELSKITGYFSKGGEFNYFLVLSWIKDLYNNKDCKDTLGDFYFNSFNSNDKRETSINYKLGINLDNILEKIEFIKEQNFDFELYFQDKKYNIEIKKEDIFKDLYKNFEIER